MSKNQFFAAAFSLAFVTGGARAQSEVSTLGSVSALPKATLTAGPQVRAGSAFVVKSVEVSAYAMVCTLERVTDGSRLVVEMSSRASRQVRIAEGMVVTASAISSGVVLEAGSEQVAFIPNALGRALLQA